jgi:hypothetical protein
MGKSKIALVSAALLLAAGLSGCGGMDESDPHYAEMSELNSWIKKLKAEDPDTGSWLAEECQKEVGFWLSKNGVLEMGRCMRRKYDEGIRWVTDEEPGVPA